MTVDIQSVLSTAFHFSLGSVLVNKNNVIVNLKKVLDFTQWKSKFLNKAAFTWISKSKAK